MIQVAFWWQKHTINKKKKNNIVFKIVLSVIIRYNASPFNGRVLLLSLLFFYVITVFKRYHRLPQNKLIRMKRPLARCRRDTYLLCCTLHSAVDQQRRTIIIMHAQQSSELNVSRFVIRTIRRNKTNE